MHCFPFLIALSHHATYLENRNYSTNIVMDMVIIYCLHSTSILGHICSVSNISATTKQFPRTLIDNGYQENTVYGHYICAHLVVSYLSLFTYHTVIVHIIL